MNKKTQTLRHVGAGTLTFMDAGARRTVGAGEDFEVGAELAEILLVDPNVVDPSALPSEAEPEHPEETGYADMNVPALRELANKRGLEVPARAPKADLVAAHVAADDAAQAGETPDEAQSVPAEPEPTSSSTGGAVTLGDLPDSAKVKS
jgi:hypothetical protein